MSNINPKTLTKNDDRELYALWPNNEIMPLDEAQDGLNSGTLGMSDDWLTVALTYEQCEDMTYDRAVALLAATPA